MTRIGIWTTAYCARWLFPANGESRPGVPRALVLGALGLGALPGHSAGRLLPDGPGPGPGWTTARPSSPASRCSARPPHGRSPLGGGRAADLLRRGWRRRRWRSHGSPGGTCPTLKRAGARRCSSCSPLRVLPGGRLHGVPVPRTRPARLARRAAPQLAPRHHLDLSLASFRAGQRPVPGRRARRSISPCPPAAGGLGSLPGWSCPPCPPALQLVPSGHTGDWMAWKHAQERGWYRDFHAPWDAWQRLGGRLPPHSGHRVRPHVAGGTAQPCWSGCSCSSLLIPPASLARGALHRPRAVGAGHLVLVHVRPSLHPPVVAAVDRPGGLEPAQAPHQNGPISA